ncbi:MAG: class I SAM-dependent methyltransferase [Parachlamydiaceae bacterium]
MNLPLEYSKLAKFFDVMSDNLALNQTLSKLLKPYPVRSLLDFSCGTGSQVLWLENRGYKVLGTDISPELVKIAKAKGLAVFEGDMRASYFGQFDAVITLDRAIGHLSRNDFERALHNIAKNLNDKGLYLFDNFNFDALSDEVVSTLAIDYEKEAEGKLFRHKQSSYLDRETKLLTSYDEFIFNDKVERGSFSLSVYSIDEIDALLKSTGFKCLEIYSREGAPFDRLLSESFILIAQKI